MRVSSRADYGVRALFELALRAGQGPVHSKEIAARQEIPEAYLHQVLGALSRAGLIRSTRGPLGGHELATSTVRNFRSCHLDGAGRRRPKDPPSPRWDRRV